MGQNRVYTTFAMSKKWKDRVQPNLIHLTSIFSDDIISAFINGHLIIETLLVQMIDLKLMEPDAFDTFSLNFPAKTSLCRALGLIDSDMTTFLLEMNKIRNRFAHRLGHTFSFDDAFKFAQDAAKGGIEFTDDSIHMDKRSTEESYGVKGIIQEVFQNTAQDLSFVMEENGGEFQFV
jgi:hypothetical protein